MFRFMTLACLALCMLPAACRKKAGEGDATRSRPRRPHILLIVVDALRPDRLGCYGCARSNSRVIDSIASESVLFERTIAAAPWTQPSMASLFASVYPGVHKTLSYELAYKGTFGGAAKVAVFDESFVTLAERLRDAGYETAAFSANPFILEDYGFAQGFDHFDSSFADTRTKGDVINRAVAAYLDRRSTDKPLFIYLHYMDVHGPYDAGPSYLDPLLDEVERMTDKRRLTDEELSRLGYLFSVPTEHTDYDRHDRLSRFQEYWVARYDAGIRQVDDFLGALREDLTRRGWWNDAWVILTSDHGEALCEHGLWDHGYSVHDTDLHVPLLLRCPGTLPAGRRIASRVRLIDLMPTLLDMLDLSPQAKVQGVSLVDRMRRDADDDPLTAFAEGVKMGDEQKAIYAGAWKLLVTPSTEVRRLYHISVDPGETKNRAADRADAVQTLSDLLDRQTRENHDRSRGLEPQQRELSQDQLERLRTLGYVGD